MEVKIGNESFSPKAKDAEMEKLISEAAALVNTNLKESQIKHNKWSMDRQLSFIALDLATKLLLSQNLNQQMSQSASDLNNTISSFLEQNKGIVSANTEDGSAS